MATVNVMSSPYYIIHIHDAMKNTEKIEEINSFVPRIKKKLGNIQSEMKYRGLAVYCASLLT